MERKVLRVFIAVLSLAIAAGCAGTKTYVPADIMPQVKAEGLVQKTDNFIVLLDRSDSMNRKFEGIYRLIIAKQAASEMAQTIPADLKLNSALRLFGSEKFGKDEATWLVYGVTPFQNNEFQKGLDATGSEGLGRTPMGRALAAAGEDIKGLSGNSAFILLSDFEHIEGVDDLRTDSVMDNIAKLKADYGDHLCIYPVHVDRDPVGQKLAEQIAVEAKCGFAENTDNLSTPEAMGAYVKKVFFGTPPPPPPPMAEEKKAAEAAPLIEEKKPAEAAPEVTKLDSVYFDFDKYNLKPEARKALKKDADWLMKNPDKKAVVEGNCDERGTVEYNLALGQRRADASAKYLMDLGIAKDRLSTISYGKERPLCQESNEQCWYKNRRADIVLKP
jgi:peptidoglycan-associated lipoprotein